MAWCPKDQDTQSSVQHITLCVQANTESNGKCGISEQNFQETSRNPVIDSDSQSKFSDAPQSGNSSESSDGERKSVERSRPVIRSASPRRSASPMRRVQIGRSGSRKPTALSLKSLSYFPARERMSINQDADANSSSDGDQPEEARKKPENSARSMSVQDRINMFESKQKGQNSDGHERRASGEVGKLVLRRWSAGMGDSFNKSSQASVPDCNGSARTTVTVPAADVEEKGLAEVKVELDASTEVVEIPRTPSSSTNNGSEVADVIDRAAAAAEWNKQKEVELNQMVLKMVENKPVKRQPRNAAGGMRPESFDEQRGDFFVQYKEKRDERLRSENAKEKEAKAARFKVMQEALEQSKAEMAERSGSLRRKQDPSAQSTHQRPLRRNSSPPVISKKVNLSKPTGPRKASPKAPPSPAVRASTATGQSPKTAGTPICRTSPGASSTSAASTRKKPQPTPSPTRPTPRAEKQAQSTSKKGGAVVTMAKPKTKGCAEKQLNSSSKERGKPARTANLNASQEDLRAAPAKPSFYNKVTKKSTVVPLETKPSKKGRGIGAGAGSVPTKTKASRSPESPKNCENTMQMGEVESATCTADATIHPEENYFQIHDNTVAEADVSVSSDLGHLNAVDQVQASGPVDDDTFDEAAEVPGADHQSDGDTGITPAARVDVEPRDVRTFDDKGVGDVISPENVCRPSFSPRIRHSLSLMLHADNSETEIIEWGNAENPPAPLACQKDVPPKGLKRLLKFAARKSKGEANVVVDWDAADDDRDDAKAVMSRSFFSAFRSSK